MNRKQFLLDIIFLLFFLESYSQFKYLERSIPRHDNTRSYDTCYTLTYDKTGKNCTHLRMELRKYNSKEFLVNAEFFDNNSPNISTTWNLNEREFFSYDGNDSLLSIKKEYLTKEGNWVKSLEITNSYQNGKLEQTRYEDRGDRVQYKFEYDKERISFCKPDSNWAVKDKIYEYEYKNGKLVSVVSKKDDKKLKEKERLEARISYEYENDLLKKMKFENWTKTEVEKSTFWDKLAAYHSSTTYENNVRIDRSFYDTPGTTRKTKYSWDCSTWKEFSYYNRLLLIEYEFGIQKKYEYSTPILRYSLKTTKYTYDTKSRLVEVVEKWKESDDEWDLFDSPDILSKKMIFGYKN